VLKFLLPFVFLIPLCFVSAGWWLVHSFIFVISFFFLFSFPYFMGWGNLGYLFGCDYISYGLILLRFWICVLIIMARESIFRSVYYPGFFLFFVVLLAVMLFCTFSRINLFSFYLFFESRLIPTVFIILG
jgi:NADH:ubiquinone oxidoreductase subunit 4 (subunit M)